MKARFRPTKSRRRVIFKRKAMSSPRPAHGMERLQPGDGAAEDLAEELDHMFVRPSKIPDLFSAPPIIKDTLETESSLVQDETVQACLPFLCGQDEDVEYYNAYGLPRLARQKHIDFLRASLERLPSRFIAADAGRPWFLYWCLSGLTLLGEDVSSYRNRVVETACSMQNDSGGFGGGGQQVSHLATTYAIVLALALVGGDEAFEVVDRKTLWKWLCSLKQPDGGFQVCLGGEEDIRGAYCAAVIISLLDLPAELTPESPAWTDGRPNLLTGVADYVRRCQTFEGGISSQPGAEAHGAYTFCALGCLSILGSPSGMIPKYLDVPRLISWLSSRQYAPEGGFSGRTNKLVDGCYSHWVGGCWPLIEACLIIGDEVEHSGSHKPLPSASASLFNREGLIRYILCCCQDQSKRGGLRDKPGKFSDPHHTCYVLSGLSTVQHQHEFEARHDNAGPLLGWKVSPSAMGPQIFDEQDRLSTLHPAYAIPSARVEEIRLYFSSKEGF